MTFEGFPANFVDFLQTLPYVNTISNLPENKETYRVLISEPLRRLYEALLPTVRIVSNSSEMRPSRCISTMFADMRFSREAPLKGYMYLRFREPGTTQDILGLYFDMGGDMYSYGIRIYKQTSGGMARIRAYVIEHATAFVNALAKAEEAGAVVVGTPFAKERHAEVMDKHLRAFLNLRDFHVRIEKDVNNVVFTTALADEIADAYIQLQPLYVLLRTALQDKENQ